MMARLQGLKIALRVAVGLGILCWFILGLLARHAPPDMALMNAVKAAGLAIGAVIILLLLAAGPRAVFSREFWR